MINGLLDIDVHKCTVFPVYHEIIGSFNTSWDKFGKFILIHLYWGFSLFKHKYIIPLSISKPMAAVIEAVSYWCLYNTCSCCISQCEWKNLGEFTHQNNYFLSFPVYLKFLFSKAYMTCINSMTLVWTDIIWHNWKPKWYHFFIVYSSFHIAGRIIVEQDQYLNKTHITPWPLNTNAKTTTNTQHNTYTPPHHNTSQQWTLKAMSCVSSTDYFSSTDYLVDGFLEIRESGLSMIDKYAFFLNNRKIHVII